MAAATRMIRADAPLGFGPESLGVPLDANFVPLVGEGAGTLFPQAGEPVETTINEVQHELALVQTAEQLAANGRAWFATGSVSSSHDARYGFYRAAELSGVTRLRDNTPMRAPPPRATYYASAIFKGHSYGEYFEGDSRSFNAEVGAHFLKLGGSAKEFKKNTRLHSRLFGRGYKLRQGVDSLFVARTPEEIGAQYEKATNQPAPILVEYRQIPATSANSGAISWVTPRRLLVMFSNLSVQSHGAWYRDFATWHMTFQCTINGQAAGQDAWSSSDRSGAPTQGAGSEFHQNVSTATYPIAFASTLVVYEGDLVACTASGSYKRRLTWQALGTASTPQLQIIGEGRENSGTMTARDAETSYSIQWSSRRLP
jgi:hypothetical protein